MIYAVIENNTVVNIIVADEQLPGTMPAQAWTKIGDKLTENGELPPEPQPEPLSEAEMKELRIAAIKLRLREIGLESIRPLRAKAAGTATAEDEAKYAALEAEAESLRAELAGLVEQATELAEPEDAMRKEADSPTSSKMPQAD